MWFPTHNRVRTARPASLSAILSSCIFCGCASLQTFDDRPVEFPIRDASEIPVPIFDDDERELYANDRSFESDNEELREDETPWTDDDEVATSSHDGRKIVTAPKPFRWERMGRSAGGREIQGITVGEDGFRVLIIGSLAGDDPEAVALTDHVARHLHENSVIFGGLKVTIVRTANPDGEAVGSRTNADDVALNRQFRIHATADARPPEVDAILNLLDEHKPQRVIHVRSFADEVGVIAASEDAAGVARNISDWLKMDFVALPGKSRDGTLERYLSEQQSAQMITIAIPRDSETTDVWQTYGDVFLNLMLSEDYQTREIARQRSQSRSASLDSRDESSDSNEFGDWTE